MTQIFAVANQKGGVGKTTTAINLGTALAAVGEKVLLVDIDPQGNASTGLGIDRNQRMTTVYDVLVNEVPAEAAILNTEIPGLDILPTTVDLAAAELELIEAKGRNKRLRRALRDIAERYNYILIDCPPALGLLTINAMVAADRLLVPLQTEFFALEGLSQLFKTIDMVKEGLNPELEIEGVVLTMYDKRNNLSDQVAADVRAVLGDKVFDTVVPRNVRVSEAPSFGKPALIYDHQCAGSQAYIALAGEMLKRARERAA